jgi:hypothetical protein
MTRAISFTAKSPTLRSVCIVNLFTRQTDRRSVWTLLVARVVTWTKIRVNFKITLEGDQYHYGTGMNAVNLPYIPVDQSVNRIVQ